MTHRPHRRTDLHQSSFERILLVKPSSLGDVIHALPVLHALRRRFPTSRIDWLIGSAFAPILEGHPDINELIMFDRRRYGRLGLNPSIALEFVRFLRALRARRYDLVVDLQGLFRTGFLSWVTGAPVRIGFAEAREGAWAFYSDRIPASPQDTHAVDRNVQVAAMFGLDGERACFRLPVSPAALAEVRAMLEGGGWSDGEPLVAVVPGARWETKLWPVDRFAELIEGLASQGAKCLILGDKNEVVLSNTIKQRVGRAVIDLIGRTTLPQLVAAIYLSDVVLCQDSAAMHIAVALDRPLVCLIGPTNPNRTGPYRRIEDVVRNPVECSPCYLRKLSQCPHQHRCMEELSVSTVFEAVRARLSEVRNRPTKMAALTIP